MLNLIKLNRDYFLTKYIIIFIIFFSINIFANVDFNIEKIRNYEVKKEFYIEDEKKFILIRSYILDNKSYFLLVNIDSLEIKSIDSLEKLKLKKVDKNILIGSNYFNLINKTDKNSFNLSNSGINQSLSKTNVNNLYLTIDMCPSNKNSFEKEFFQNLKNISIKEKRKIPIALAITYKWAKYHKNEFEFLLNSKDNFDITWINHSKTHFYNPNLKLSNNFMLYDKKEFEKEILDVEKLLILNKELPSILFRFPGLISDKSLINKLINNYSLIPLGTNNWIAKKEKKLESGDIVLVHGNLNEHKGIEIINKDINNFSLFPILEALKEKRIDE